MFKLVRAPENSLVLVYKTKKSGKISLFGSTRVTKPKCVPVLWGYTHAVLTGAALNAGTDLKVTCADGELYIDYAATVEISEWVAENALKNLVGVSEDGIVELARERIEKAIAELAATMEREKFLKNKSDNAFSVVRQANTYLAEIGLVLLAFRMTERKSN